MGALVTEKWSDRRWVPLRSGQRAWVVTGVADEAGAIAAVGPDIEAGATFPQDGQLTADTPDVRRVGPVAFEVSCAYKFNPGGSTVPLDTDPLARPPKIRWAKGTISGQTDADADGRVLVNSAGLPLNPSPPAESSFRILTVTRWEGRYDVDLADSYEDSVNSDNVLIPMAGTVQPGQMQCVQYEPMTEYDMTSRFVQVAYVFWIGRRKVKDADGLWDCWKHRILDQGMSGFSSSGNPQKRGPFVYNNDGKDPVNEPVLLDGKGTPLKTGVYLVAKGSATTAGAVTPVANNQALEDAIVETTKNAVFLKYTKYRKLPFSGLNLF